MNYELKMIPSTTYALTARFMIDRDGLALALKEAKRYAAHEDAKRRKRREYSDFWRYVVKNIEQIGADVASSMEAEV